MSSKPAENSAHHGGPSQHKALHEAHSSRHCTADALEGTTRQVQRSSSSQASGCICTYRAQHFRGRGPGSCGAPGRRRREVWAGVARRVRERPVCAGSRHWLASRGLRRTRLPEPSRQGGQGRLLRVRGGLAGVSADKGSFRVLGCRIPSEWIKRVAWQSPEVAAALRVQQQPGGRFGCPQQHLAHHALHQPGARGAAAEQALGHLVCTRSTAQQEPTSSVDKGAHNLGGSRAGAQPPGVRAQHS